MGSERVFELKLTRREFIAAVTGCAIGGIGVALTTRLEPFNRRFFPSAPEAEDLEPYAFYDGPIAIYRGARLRTSPRFPNRTRFRKPTNTIDFSEIDFIDDRNQRPPVKVEAFVINRPEIVKGQPAGRMPVSYKEEADGTLVPDEYGPDDDDWIKLVSNPGGRDFPLYVNLFGSLPFVQQLIRGSLEKLPGNYNDFGNYSLLGQVFVPSSPERAARDVVPSIWAKPIADKLDGKIPLNPRSERMVLTAKVVASGDSLEEKTQMEGLQTPVNVRNYPAKQYLNDEPVEIVGVVKQGTEIRNLLILGWWAACRRLDILGDLHDADGKALKTDSNQVVAISTLYLSYLASK